MYHHIVMRKHWKITNFLFKYFFDTINHDFTHHIYLKKLKLKRLISWVSRWKGKTHDSIIWQMWWLVVLYQLWSVIPSALLYGVITTYTLWQSLMKITQTRLLSFRLLEQVYVAATWKLSLEKFMDCDSVSIFQDLLALS